MNDDRMSYMETVIAEERSRLVRALHHAKESYNSIGRDMIQEITTGTYTVDDAVYDTVLIVKFVSGRTGYINIDANSVLATLTVLNQYIYGIGGKCCGFLAQVY